MRNILQGISKKYIIMSIIYALICTSIPFALLSVLGVWFTILLSVFCGTAGFMYSLVVLLYK